MTHTPTLTWSDFDAINLADDLAHRLFLCRCERRDLTAALRRAHHAARTDAQRDDLMAVLRLERDLGLAYAAAEANARDAGRGGADSTSLTTARLLDLWRNA
jgi:hypothetical protein